MLRQTTPRTAKVARRPRMADFSLPGILSNLLDHSSELSFWRVCAVTHGKIGSVWPYSLPGVPDILVRRSCVHSRPLVTRQLALTLSTRPSPIEWVRLPIAAL